MEDYQYKVSDFEGPLDLLLYLIEKNKVDIYHIPIVEITDQFNAYVQQIQDFDVNYASKFFVMAATLLQIKSRLLLPKAPKTSAEEEEDPQDALLRQLTEYKHLKEVSALLDRLWQQRSLMEGRERTPMPFEKQFSGHLDKKALYEAFRSLYQSLEKKQPVIHLTQEVYSVNECMERVEELLQRSRRPVLVTAVCRTCRTKMELVVVFLAVLELLKLGRCRTLSEGEDGNAVALRYIPQPVA